MVNITVVIVLYNEFDKVINCINSVYAQKISHLEIILVDNSTEIGIKKVLKKFPKLHYKKNKENLGFGPAANVGLKLAKGKFTLLLTPDTTLMSHTIVPTLKYITDHDDVAIVGCRVYSSDRTHNQSVYHSFPNLLSHLYEYNVPFYKLCRRLFPEYHPLLYSREAHKKLLNVQHMIGAYLLMRKNALEEVGYFDTHFRLYREETDLCRRLVSHGWKIIYLPVGGLIHYGGADWKTARLSQALPSYMTSTYLFFKKYNGIYYASFAYILGLFSSIFSLFYLYGVIAVKGSFNQSSQATFLLPEWKKIFKWHIRNGLLS